MWRRRPWFILTAALLAQHTADANARPEVPRCTDKTAYVTLMASHQSTVGPSTFLAKNGSFATVEAKHARQVQLIVALVRSLRDVELCRRDFVLLLGTQVPLSTVHLDALKQEGVLLHPTPPLIPGVPTADKLQAWKLTEYTQCLVLDVDAVSYTHLTLPTTPYV